MIVKKKSARVGGVSCLSAKEVGGGGTLILLWAALKGQDVNRSLQMIWTNGKKKLQAIL